MPIEGVMAARLQSDLATKSFWRCLSVDGSWGYWLNTRLRDGQQIFNWNGVCFPFVAAAGDTVVLRSVGLCSMHKMALQPAARNPDGVVATISISVWNGHVFVSIFDGLLYSF